MVWKHCPGAELLLSLRIALCDQSYSHVRHVLTLYSSGSDAQSSLDCMFFSQTVYSSIFISIVCLESGQKCKKIGKESILTCRKKLILRIELLKIYIYFHKRIKVIWYISIIISLNSCSICQSVTLSANFLQIQFNTQRRSCVDTDGPQGKNPANLSCSS